MRSPALTGLVLAVLVQAPLAGQYPPTTASQAPAPSPVKLSGYIQAREVYQSEIGLTSSINRARLTASGGIVQGVTWRVQGEFRTGSVGTGRAERVAAGCLHPLQSRHVGGTGRPIQDAVHS